MRNPLLAALAGALLAAPVVLTASVGKFSPIEGRMNFFVNDLLTNQPTAGSSSVWTVPVANIDVDGNGVFDTVDQYDVYITDIYCALVRTQDATISPTIGTSMRWELLDQNGVVLCERSQSVSSSSGYTVGEILAHFETGLLVPPGTTSLQMRITKGGGGSGQFNSAVRMHGFCMEP